MYIEPVKGTIVDGVENGALPPPEQHESKEGPRTFEELAESFRGLSANIDGQWVLSEHIKTAAADELFDLGSAVEEDDDGPAVNRAQKRESRGRLDYRAIGISVESLALVLRYGTHEFTVTEQEDGAELDPNKFHGYAQMFKFVSVPLAAKREALEDDDSIDLFDAERDRIVVENANELIKTYAYIYLNSPTIVQATAEFAGFSLAKANSFVEWLEKVDTEQDGDFRAALQLLAHDVLGKDDASNILRTTLQRLEEEAYTLLVEPFSERVLKGSEEIANPATKAWLIFIEKLFEKTHGYDTEEVRPELYKYVAELRSDWPPELETEYKAFAHRIIENFEMRMKAVLEKYQDRSRQTPSKTHLDRVLEEVTFEKPAGKRRTARGVGRAAMRGRAKTALKNALPNLGEDKTRKALPAILKQMPDNSLVETEGATEGIDIMIAKYCKANPEAGLERAITDLIDHVMTDPYGPGTKNLTARTVKVNGKRYTLRRATLRSNEEVESSGNIAYRTQLVYIVVTNNGDAPVVAIKHIIHHKVFDHAYIS